MGDATYGVELRFELRISGAVEREMNQNHDNDDDGARLLQPQWLSLNSEAHEHERCLGSVVNSQQLSMGSIMQ